MTENRITIVDGLLVVEPQGMDKLWSFTSRIEVPLADVTSATVDPRVIDDPKGVRFPGLHLPDKVAGMFYTNGKRQFWNVTGYGNAIVVELDARQRFDRLVLSVDDPEREVAAIQHALPIC